MANRHTGVASVTVVQSPKEAKTLPGCLTSPKECIKRNEGSHQGLQNLRTLRNLRDGESQRPDA